MYWQYRRAEITVSAAAQAASHAIDVEYFRQTNQVQLNLGEAWDVAQGFIWINQRGHMQVQGIWVGEDEIVVAATAYVDTLFLRFAGINRLPLRAIGRAYPAFGINREGQLQFISRRSLWTRRSCESCANSSRRSRRFKPRAVTPPAISRRFFVGWRNISGF